MTNINDAISRAAIMMVCATIRPSWAFDRFAKFDETESAMIYATAILFCFFVFPASLLIGAIDGIFGDWWGNGIAIAYAVLWMVYSSNWLVKHRELIWSSLIMRN